MIYIRRLRVYPYVSRMYEAMEVSFGHRGLT